MVADDLGEQSRAVAEKKRGGGCTPRLLGRAKLKLLHVSEIRARRNPHMSDAWVPVVADRMDRLDRAGRRGSCRPGKGRGGGWRPPAGPAWRPAGSVKGEMLATTGPASCGGVFFFH